MRKAFMIVLGFLLVFSLSACEDVYIEPGVIDIQFENVHYEGESIVMDIWITNGTSEHYDIGYMEFALYIPDTETEYCGAGFDMLATILSDDYESFEIEFTSEFVFLTETELEDLGYTLEDLELYYWVEE
jgi:hypothetical protein